MLRNHLRYLRKYVVVFCCLFGFLLVIWVNWPFKFPLNEVSLFVLGLFQTTWSSFQKSDQTEKLFHT